MPAPDRRGAWACDTFCFRAAWLSVCWWGDMTFGDHIWALLGLPGFEATLRFAPKGISSPDRKQLARRAEASVRHHFTATHVSAS